MLKFLCAGPTRDINFISDPLYLEERLQDTLHNHVHFPRVPKYKSEPDVENGPEDVLKLKDHTEANYETLIRIFSTDEKW